MLITVLNSFTVSWISTILIYIIFYRRFIKKIQLPKKIVLFILIGWMIMLVQITLLSNTFIAAISGQINLQPFHFITEDLLISGQLDSVKQFLLNILMFMPFGFLFPIYKQKKAPFYTILLGFAITLSIEVIQMFIGRSFDIDDVIANFIGVIFGLCYYCLFVTINQFFNKKERQRENYVYSFLAIGLTMILILLPVSARRYVMNNTNGFFLYTHERPTEIIYNTELSETNSKANIYKSEPILEEDLFKKIVLSEFNINLSKVNKTDYNSMIYETNDVSLNYQDDGSMDIRAVDKQKPLIKAEIKTEDYENKALYYLDQLYQLNSIFKSTKLELRDNEGTKEVIINVNKLSDNVLYYGKIFVSMNESGDLLGIHSTLVKGIAKEKVEIKSNSQASEIIKKTGNFNKALKVTVLKIEPAYDYNQQTRTLNPTWKFEGVDSQSNAWSANIDATLK